MQVTLQYVNEHLSDVVSAMVRGEEVEIAEPAQPAMKLVLAEPAPFVSNQGRRVLGAGRGEMRVPSIEEWAAMDREIAAEMNDRPLVKPAQP